MIKFLIGFNAAPGLSRAQSLLHYRERHAPLVSGMTSFWRHVGGYVQNGALAEGSGAPALPADVDGVSELWFDDWDSYDRAFAEPLYLEHIRPDEQRFADFGSLIVVFADDVAIVGGDATPPYKLLRFLRRRDDVVAAAFRDDWQTRHAAAVAADPAVRRFATGYVQNRPLARDGGDFAPSDCDGVDEYGFASVADLKAFLAEERGRESLDPMAGKVVQIATATRVVEAPPSLAGMSEASIGAGR